MEIMELMRRNNILPLLICYLLVLASLIIISNVYFDYKEGFTTDAYRAEETLN